MALLLPPSVFLDTYNDFFLNRQKFLNKFEFGKYLNSSSKAKAEKVLLLDQIKTETEFFLDCLPWLN